MVYVSGIVYGDKKYRKGDGKFSLKLLMLAVYKYI